MWKPGVLAWVGPAWVGPIWVGLLGLAVGASTARADELSGPVTPAEYEAAMDAALETYALREGAVTSRRIVPCPYGVRAPRQAPGNRWKFGISPYAFLADTSGDVWTDGVKTSFEIPFDEILEVTNGGFQLYLEARYGRWYFAFDGTIAQLGKSEEGKLLGFDVTIDQVIADLRVGWRFKRWVVSSGQAKMGARPHRTVDAYVFTGTRYFRTDIEARLTVLGRPRPNVTTTDETFDPLLGLRVVADLSRRWTLDLRGEAAAFGTSGTDRYSWETAAYLSYHFSRHWSAYVGWRVQGQVDVQGTGAEKNGTDIVVHGPLIGAGFSF